MRSASFLYYWAPTWGRDLELLLGSELCRIGPSECLAPDSIDPTAHLSDQLPSGCRLTRRPVEEFSPRRAVTMLCDQFELERIEALGAHRSNPVSRRF